MPIRLQRPKNKIRREGKCTIAAVLKFARGGAPALPEAAAKRGGHRRAQPALVQGQHRADKEVQTHIRYLRLRWMAARRTCGGKRSGLRSQIHAALVVLGGSSSREQHNMWVVAGRRAILSVITGGGKWVEIKTDAIGTLAAALAKAQALLVNPEKSMVATIRKDGPGSAEQVFRYAPLSHAGYCRLLFARRNVPLGGNRHEEPTD